MTSVATSGYQGIFKVSTVALVQIQSCEIQFKGETYDVTVMSGTSAPQWKAFIAGLLDAQIKVVGFWDQINDAGQATLWTDFTGGTAVSWSFSPNAGTNKYSGSGYITGIPLKFPVNGAETWEIDIQSSGAITFA